MSTTARLIGGPRHGELVALYKQLYEIRFPVMHPVMASFLPKDEVPDYEDMSVYTALVYRRSHYSAVLNEYIYYYMGEF